MNEESKIQEAAERIVGLGEEVEASVLAVVDEPSVIAARKVLHEWIDEVKAVLVTPAFGRVTVIHTNGNASSIGSSDLAFRMAAAGVT